jgi:hypothetical protein
MDGVHLPDAGPFQTVEDQIELELELVAEVLPGHDKGP